MEVDRIFLKGLKVDTVIGIWEWERRTKQIVMLDLEMQTDVRSAAKSDSIDVALDYKAIAKHLTDFVSTSEFQLVETLAEAVAKIIVIDFAVPWVKLSVSKPRAIEGSDNVGVTIERTSGDYA